MFNALESVHALPAEFSSSLESEFMHAEDDLWEDPVLQAAESAGAEWHWRHEAAINQHRVQRRG